jgi:hypothetical protein
MNDKHECQWCGELTDIRDTSCTTCYLQLLQLEMSTEEYAREMDAWYESEYAEK